MNGVVSQSASEPQNLKQRACSNVYEESIIPDGEKEIKKKILKHECALSASQLTYTHFDLLYF